MKLGTTYICTWDIHKSCAFYQTLLNQKPVYRNEDRWITFACGISLYNQKYDEKLIEENKLSHFNQAYLDEFFKEEQPRKNNLVVFNFEVEDLCKEYKRIKDLAIGEMTEILYVNIISPYYYFNLTDPDGNILEITGNYK